MTSRIISTLDSLREPLANSHFLSPEEKTDIEARVQSLAEQVLSDRDLPHQQQEEALRLIRLSTPNTAINRGTGCFFNANLMHPLSAPAKGSTPYPGELQIPFVASYHGWPTHNFIVRLNPLDCQHILPKAVKDAIGKRTPVENIDLFLLHERNKGFANETVSGKYFGKFFKKDSSELLVKFHTWLYPDLPVGSDITLNPLMGVFPDFGITTAQYKPISLGSLSNQRVHAHPAKDDKSFMLYSPNNSHIAIDQKAPFCGAWIVAKHENRACAAKILFPTNGLDNPAHNLFKEFFELHTLCESAGEYTRRLKDIKGALEGFLTDVFSPLQGAASERNPGLMQAMLEGIPESFKNKIMSEFQKMEPSANPEDSFFAASAEQQRECIQRVSDSILYCLIDEQIALIEAVKPVMIAAAERPTSIPIALIMSENISRKDTVHIMGDGPGMHKWARPFHTFQAGLGAVIEINLPYCEEEYEFKIVKEKTNGERIWQKITTPGQQNKRSMDEDVQSGMVVVEFPTL